jgi:hypothetical protein
MMIEQIRSEYRKNCGEPTYQNDDGGVLSEKYRGLLICVWNGAVLVKKSSRFLIVPYVCHTHRSHLESQ